MDQDFLDRCARARFHLPADAVLTGVTALRLHGIDVGHADRVRAATGTSAQTRRAEIRLWPGPCAPTTRARRRTVGRLA